MLFYSSRELSQVNLETKKDFLEMKKIVELNIRVIKINIIYNGKS
jgi:hypothetical protein